ncbi:hypothetical protein B0H66DRAFT_526145 [Apodospora peruviana]|uniref:Uncharacterized protein n=1 Tax=Apodospora peruviana TaxID=516989 RepID=A0AAE0MEG1_9PEZI|nr:hypothetical protein B0H66DRAFT_526145 [Apodospora peruviana]
MATEEEKTPWKTLPGREPIRTGMSKEEFDEARQNARLSIPAGIRIPLSAGLAFFVGLCLGSTQGSRMAGLRFRAEHAHKLPSSMTGWYLYHKSKNYHVAYGGIREGLRMGRKVSIWTTAMFGIEHMFDCYRGSADLFNTVTASVTVAGCFSLWNRFSLPMAARTTKTALIVGTIYGGLQDLLGYAKGRPIGYVEAFNRRFRPHAVTADHRRPIQSAS